MSIRQNIADSWIRCITSAKEEFTNSEFLQTVIQLMLFRFLIGVGIGIGIVLLLFDPDSDPEMQR